MLNFIYHENNEILKESEVFSYVSDHEDVLVACQQGHAIYRDSLGWLDVEEWGGKKWIDQAKQIANEIRSFADCFVIIGVGGSNNSARAVIEALDLDERMKIVYAGNTLSPYSLNKVLKELEGRSVAIDCIAKNFETLEPGSSFRFLRQYLVEKYGKEEAKRRIFATGTVGSHLEDLCKQHGYTFIPFPSDIGGRYTAHSPVHLVPLAVAGVNVDDYAQGAMDMMMRLQAAKGKDNPSLFYASIRKILYDKGYRVEVLSAFEPRLRCFFYWWEQLFAESEGKDHKGLLPVSGEFSEQLHSMGQYLQEGSPILFETFLSFKEHQASLILKSDDVDDGFDYLDGKDFYDINEAAFKATLKAHAITFPCMELQLDRIDAYNFGALFYFYEFTCYVSSVLLGVNPFNQPGVEAYKKEMFRILGK